MSTHTEFRVEWKDRLAGAELRSILSTRHKALIAAGFAWGFVSWMFFWYTLLPIARDGAPFRVSAASSMFVAPTWVFLVGFTVLGVVTSVTYRALRRS